MYDVTFLERGSAAAKAVSLLTIQDEFNNERHSTGFLIAENWVLTAHHALFPSSTESSGGLRAVTVLFDYAWSSDGSALARVERKGNVGSIIGDKEHDWAAIQLERRMPKRFPFLALTPKTPVRVGDPVFIIQHPKGGPKMVALARDPVSYIDDRIIQYGTDTQPGSSGAPVFNEAWEVVGMHHSGGWLRRPSANEHVYINQGIRIERIISGLRTKGIQIGEQLGRGGEEARAYLSVHASDLPFAEDLEKHLAPLRSAGKLSVWHRGKAHPGSTPSDDAARELRAADLVLIILSPDYVASTEHIEEAKNALERSKREGVRVVPVLARPSSWELTPLGGLQPLPQDRCPLVLQQSADQAYVDIAKAVGAILSDNYF
jgi:V8-like Glu-specific endopeptidase